MYICHECKEEFREPDIMEYAEESEYWGRPVEEVFSIEKCPHCGSDEIEEVSECPICGQAAPDGDFCDGCHKNLQYDLDRIKQELSVDYETLQELIAEHFGW